jgi:hypothetical protein
MIRTRRRICQANGIHYCDLTSGLQAETRQGRQLYLRISSHWNDAGNLVGAKAIASCLADQGLVGRGTDGARAAATAAVQ